MQDFNHNVVNLDFTFRKNINGNPNNITTLNIIKNYNFKLPNHVRWYHITTTLKWTSNDAFKKIAHVVAAHFARPERIPLDQSSHLQV